MTDTPRILTPEVADPQLLQERARKTTTQPTIAVEAAWCFELHEQLQDLNATLADPFNLILMGGHGASLRLNEHGLMGRGSRDTDYLTDASEEQIIGLAYEAISRMAAGESSLRGVSSDTTFKPRRIGGMVEHPLPLLSLILDVPALLDMGGIRPVSRWNFTCWRPTSFLHQSASRLPLFLC